MRVPFSFVPSIIIRVLGGVVALFLLMGGVWYELSCTEVKSGEPVPSTHGYRTWDGEQIKSFFHSGRRVCVPEGWRALGATSEGRGWAKFERGVTGVLIQNSAFKTEIMEPVGSRFSVEVIYPLAVDIEAYRPLIMRVFEKSAELYEIGVSKRTPHTVLITYALESVPLYPDPNESRTIIVRGPTDARGKELAYHAVAHLYNRFGGIDYQQPPFSKGDFEELVASWSEIAFMDARDVRQARVGYLYRVHVAVMTDNFSLIKGPPFSDRAAFEKISPTTIVPEDGTYLDFQYGHYVLAPLVMLALDGLLHEHSSSMFTVLHALHTDENMNFIDMVKQRLTPEQFETALSWIHGREQIPWDAVARGLAVYE